MVYLKKYWKTLVLMFAVVVMAGVFTYLTIFSRHNISENSAVAKSFVVQENEKAYTNLNGEEVELIDFVDGVTVVNSWASWSPSSARELVDLSEIGNEFKDRGVKIVAINRSEPASTANRFLSSIDELQNVTFILDSDDKYFKSIEGYSMPETVVYDSDGNIRMHIRGDFNKDELIVQIEELVKEK